MKDKMTYSQLKKQLKREIAQKRANREMRDHYAELLAAATGELKFKNMKVDFLRSVLNEVLTISDSELVKAVIENALNREDLDTIIHAKIIFNK